MAEAESVVCAGAEGQLICRHDVSCGTVRYSITGRGQALHERCLLDS